MRMSIGKCPCLRNAIARCSYSWGQMPTCSVPQIHGLIEHRGACTPRLGVDDSELGQEQVARCNSVRIRGVMKAQLCRLIVIMLFPAPSCRMHHDFLEPSILAFGCWVRVAETISS